MSNITSDNKKDIKMLTSRCTPKIHLDFIYLKLWTTSESIDHLTSRILLDIVRTFLAVEPESQVDSWETDENEMSLFLCVLPQPSSHSSMYALCGKLIIKVAVTEPLPPFQLQNIHCLCSRKGTCFVHVHTTTGTQSMLCINPEVK